MMIKIFGRIYSDRGVQYASTDFTQDLKKRQFMQSMSRKDDGWDTRVAGSFFHLLLMGD